MNQARNSVQKTRISLIRFLPLFFRFVMAAVLLVFLRIIKMFLFILFGNKNHLGLVDFSQSVPVTGLSNPPPPSNEVESHFEEQEGSNGFVSARVLTASFMKNSFTLKTDQFLPPF